MARRRDAATIPTTDERPPVPAPTPEEGLAGAFYATLRKLGCVKCETCGGSYALPGHTEHRTLFDPLLETVAAEVAR
jgi:hypothetical protein